jgi:PAS domain S-box-containing protein
MDEKKKIDGTDYYAALVETTDTGYVILDAMGHVIDANKEYVRLTGYNTLDQIKGRSVVEWTAPYDQERNAQEVKKCFEKGYVRNLVIDYIMPNGNAVPIEINATVVDTNQGKQIVTLCRDITERKKTEAELIARNKELERMNNLMINRELKMSELKRKVEELEGKLKGANTN